MRNSYQTAGHVEPDIVGVVFYRPMNRVAGQSVVPGQGRHTSVLHPAQPAFGGRPQRTVRIESKVRDKALAETVGSRIRCANPTVSHGRETAVVEPKP